MGIRRLNSNIGKLILILAFLMPFAFIMGILIGARFGLMKKTSLAVLPTPSIMPAFQPTGTPKDTPIPTRSSTPRPNATKTHQYWVRQTKTAEASTSCIRYDRVNETHVGVRICVYGEVVKWYTTDEFAAIIRFENEKDNIIIRGVWSYWPDVKSGECIAVVGVVETNNQYFFIEPSGFEEGLYMVDFCE